MRTQEGDEDLHSELPTFTAEQRVEMMVCATPLSGLLNLLVSLGHLGFDPRLQSTVWSTVWMAMVSSDPGAI
jgi:hypothetical protein